MLSLRHGVLDKDADVGKRGEQPMDGTNRIAIRPGLRVSIVLKQDQKNGKQTEGIVAEILTKSSYHPHGIKVRLESGDIGRVKTIK